MKKRLLGMFLLAGASALASSAHAESQGAPWQGASRWSSSVMDRHMPLDSAQLQKLGQKKFRYMDMARSKQPAAIRNAVIVHGPATTPMSAPVYRNNAQPRRPLVILRPMT
jgi:hypothetical protein